MTDTLTPAETREAELVKERDEARIAINQIGEAMGVLGIVQCLDDIVAEAKKRFAKLTKAVEALKSLHHAVCGKNGFAAAVRNHSGKAYPWEPLDIADEQTRDVLAELEGKE